MGMLRAYLIEDEPFARDELKYLLARLREVKVIGESDTMEEAVSDIKQLEPDVIFFGYMPCGWKRPGGCKAN